MHLPSTVLCIRSTLLGRTTFAINCTVHQEHLTWAYCICHQLYCAGHHVYQEPHFGVLHLPSSVLYWPSCISGASLLVYYSCHKVRHIGIELYYVYYISHQVYCRSHHVLQEPHLGVLFLLQIYCKG